MTLEILNANQLYYKGKMGSLKAQDPQFLNNKRFMCFSRRRETLNFARDFVLEYLVPKYKEDANKFPLLRTGPTGRDLFDELNGILKRSISGPRWLAIPEERFHEVEEFLKQYKI